jgi:hypothetical protein
MVHHARPPPAAGDQHLPQHHSPLSEPAAKHFVLTIAINIQPVS